jgi:hypothetical protein
MRPISPILLLLAGMAVAACGKETPSSSPSTPPASVPPSTAAAAAWVLAADPAGGTTVLEAKKAGPKDEVVVVGRVKDVVPGFAAFTLADPSLKYCGFEGDNMPDCEEPWDYCCTPADELTAGVLAVAVKDAKGETVSHPRLPEIRNLDLVAVKGRLVKEKDGTLALEATGWYRRERPKLPDSIKFP